MYNPKKYYNSDAAQPALIGTQHGLVNPDSKGSPIGYQIISPKLLTEDGTQILIKSLTKKLYRRRKINDTEGIRAVKILLKEIRNAEKDYKKWEHEMGKDSN